MCPSLQKQGGEGGAEQNAQQGSRAGVLETV